ncbi:MAG: hypothetical protein KJO23_01980 [Bacteroidia bacterium]|nr:hypothetical protein [Bacteroidia bacterium]NNM23121.1 hypothetical protein [Flavobacteriaceae bacterium]
MRLTVSLPSRLVLDTLLLPFRVELATLQRPSSSNIDFGIYLLNL